MIVGFGYDVSVVGFGYGVSVMTFHNCSAVPTTEHKGYIYSVVCEFDCEF